MANFSTLGPLLEKVAHVHGEHDPRLLKVKEIFFAAGQTADVRGALRRIRELTEDYQLPEWACTSYRKLFAELQALESGG